MQGNRPEAQIYVAT